MSSQSTQNLIGFLAKKSLFKTDPKPTQKTDTTTKQKPINEINSVRDDFSRSISPKAKYESKSRVSEFNVFQDKEQREFFKKGTSAIEIPMSRTVLSTTTAIKPKQQGSNRFDNKIINKNNSNSNNDVYYSHVKQNSASITQKQQYDLSQKQNPQTSSFFRPSNTSNLINKTPTNNTSSNNNNLLTGFKPSPPAKQPAQTPKPFQKLQQQSSQCLSHLSHRLHSSILTITTHIDTFNANLFKSLTQQLEQIKLSVMQMVEKAFKESEKSIRMYMRRQEVGMLQEMVAVKQRMEREQGRVEMMRGAINTGEWRKTAAELIASDLENRVDQLVDQSNTMRLNLPQISQEVRNQKLNQLNEVLLDLFEVSHWGIQ